MIKPLLEVSEAKNIGRYELPLVGWEMTSVREVLAVLVGGPEFHPQSGCRKADVVCTHVTPPLGKRRREGALCSLGGQRDW